eukprot:TRINITY_DN105760_c0_g1_i1.p1 TRINITY_DN105760_c0_g1~~TRINITY_DN105760_c0_g1_i1.p1  ORF type:complete len:575 (+),score=140.58 TRINITY_DN105760_c0_g1_i1:14-1738(+)
MPTPQSFDVPAPQAVADTWSNFLRERSEELPISTPEKLSKDSKASKVQPVPKQELASKKEPAALRKESATRKAAREKSAVSPKRRPASKGPVATDRDAKAVIDAALSSDAVAHACETVAASLQAGSTAEASGLLGSRSRPKLERFPTPPGFDEAWAAREKKPKCPGGLADGLNFFSSNGFAPPDRTGATSGSSMEISFPDEMARQTVASDWKQVQAKSKLASEAQRKATAGGSRGGPAAAKRATSRDAKQKSSGISGFFKSMTGGQTKASSKSVDAESEADDTAGASSSAMLMGFNELAKMNAGILGADMQCFSVVLASFEQLIAAACNADEGALEGACDVLALQLNRAQAKGAANLKQFQTCMLSSARALLPEAWDAQHEGAWIKTWECIAAQLEKTLVLPPRYEIPVRKFVTGMAEKDKHQIGLKTFERLFKEHPKAENYFKQNNARLASFVVKSLDMSVQLFQEPQRMVAEITQLGLRHIMFQASTRFVQPLVSSIVAEVQRTCKDALTVEGVNWALCIIGSIMFRTIETGATPILKAVVRNDVKGLKKALSKTPKGDRNQAILGSIGSQV